uniref:DNA-directed RNA polymerase I largest subunit, putative n=1 Tax=Arundo donax TaxID=35708 RepID=A0A0A9GX88_ARUDO
MQNLASFFHKSLRMDSTSVGKRCFFPDDATISLIVSSERHLVSLINPLDSFPGEFCSSSRPETPVSLDS